MTLYVSTLSELEVPARDKPSAMRSLTGRVMEVLTTASTYEVIRNFKISTAGFDTDQAEHIFCTYEHDDQRKDSPAMYS